MIPTYIGIGFGSFVGLPLAISMEVGTFGNAKTGQVVAGTRWTIYLFMLFFTIMLRENE